MQSADGARLPLAEALRREFPDIVALDASVAKGRAYLACHDANDHVRPRYLLLDRVPFDETSVIYKDLELEESPSRWPSAIAAALTTWQP